MNVHKLIESTVLFLYNSVEYYLWGEKVKVKTEKKSREDERLVESLVHVNISLEDPKYQI